MKWTTKQVTLWVCALAVFGGTALQIADRLPGRILRPSKPSLQVSSPRLTTGAASAGARATAMLRSLPMSFEPAAESESTGRTLDTGASPQFVGRAAGMAVLLTGEGITLQANVRHAARDTSLLRLSFDADGSVAHDTNARPSALTWSSGRPRGGATNYLLGRDAR